MKHYDLIVIGTGAGGLTAGFTGLGFGKKVLLVDKANPGGECTWSGCIPSKALINIAKQAHAASSFQDCQLSIDTTQVLEQVRAVIDTVYAHETPEKLQEAGADFVQGAARFIDKNTIEVNGEPYSAKRFVIATGSSPLVAPIPGLDSVNYLTNESFFTQKKLPESIIVLGGGAIGLELAQAMNRLGTTVTVVEMMPDVLFREEPEMAAQLREQIASEGVSFLTGSKATQVSSDHQGITVTVEKDGNSNAVQATALLVALGRKANTGQLGLEAVGIDADNFIKVNAKMQTSLPHVYACGDVVGPYQFSHMANYQGKIATMNALLPIKRKTNYQHAAWSTFTEPELARTGMTEQEAREKHGDNIRIYQYDFDQLDRAKTKPGEQGRIKLICDKRGRVLGAHILGPRAGELICEVQVIKTLGKSFSALQSVIHPYPTYADSLRQLAQQVYLDKLLNNPVVTAGRKLKALFSPQRPAQ